MRASEIVWHLGKATDEGCQHAVRIVRATAVSVLRGFQKGSFVETSDNATDNVDVFRDPFAGHVTRVQF